ncbi:hypothetical protein [Microvirga massiliensis]|uniref:hypothetical protein n=1 Tax=Microvirga massiliensis TaxID=1033741 RepID=UPI00062BB4E3|nr:hypothetical protein [Microvirga massiliensis]
MPRTTNDLIRRVLGLLEVVAAGQPVAVEDAELVRATLPSVRADLSARGVAVVADTDAIDDAAFLPLAELVAAAVAADFGVAAPDRSAAELRLRAQQPTGETGEPIEAEYF